MCIRDRNYSAAEEDYEGDAVITGVVENMGDNTITVKDSTDDQSYTFSTEIAQMVTGTKGIVVGDEIQLTSVSYTHLLVEEGLLTEEACLETDFGDDLRTIDYDKVHAGKKSLFKIAYENWKEKENLDSPEKIHEKARQGLMEDTVEYCFYMALREAFDDKEWTKWEEGIRLRRPEALDHYRRELADEIGFHESVSYTHLKEGKVRFPISEWYIQPWFLQITGRL